jgi:uncharacterized coiled-coil DUF342 family protein
MATLKDRMRAFVDPKTRAIIPTVERYYELCDRRDAVNKQIQPIKDRIAKISTEILTRQADAEKLVEEMNFKRGGTDWIELKKEIAQIARFLVRIPPRVK